MVDGRCRVDERDKILSFMHHVDLVFSFRLVEKRFLHFEDHLRSVVDFLRVVDNGRPRLHIILVMEEGAIASRFLHEHIKTLVHEFRHGFGCSRHTCFIVHNLFGNANNHLIKFKG